MVGLISDARQSLWTRSLAVAALGACLGTSTKAAPDSIQDVVLMDALIDLIGQTKSAEPRVLGFTHGDNLKMR